MRTVAALLVAACIALAATAHEPGSLQPIRLHPTNPPYFLYRGKTIALFTSGEHYGSVFNADFDCHKYLATIEADGLNFTRIFGGSYVEVPGKFFGHPRNDPPPGAANFIQPW